MVPKFKMTPAFSVYSSSTLGSPNTGGINLGNARLNLDYHQLWKLHSSMSAHLLSLLARRLATMAVAVQPVCAMPELRGIHLSRRLIPSSEETRPFFRVCWHLHIIPIIRITPLISSTPSNSNALLLLPTGCLLQAILHSPSLSTLLICLTPVLATSSLHIPYRLPLAAVYQQCHR